MSCLLLLMLARLSRLSVTDKLTIREMLLCCTVVYSGVQWCSVYSVQCGGGGGRSTGSQPSVTMIRDEPGEVQELRDELNMRLCIFPCPASRF